MKYYNMKKTIIFFVFIFITKISFGQNKVVADSILKKKIDSLVYAAAGLWYKDLDSAEVICKYMLNYSNSHNFLKGKGMSYGSFASVYSIQGKEGKSIAYSIKAAKVFESTGNKTLLSKTNYNIGAGLIDQNQFEEALVYIEKAHDFFLKTKKDKYLVLTYTALGAIYLETNKTLDTVITTLKKGEKLAIAKKDTLALGSILNIKGQAYIQKNKNLPLAISETKKSLRLVKIKNLAARFRLGFSYLLLGKAYWKMGAYNKALRYNDSSVAMYNGFGYIKGLKLAYESRKDILASQGNYKQSFKAFEVYNQHKDSLFQKQRVNQVVRMKTEFETDQIIAEKETAETKVKLTETISKQNRNYFIGSVIIGFLMVMISIFYFKKLKDRKKLELMTLEFNENEKRLVIEKQLVESKLESLQAQMNPHFTFNALNSIQNLVLKGSKYEAYDYLSKFSLLIRENLNMSRKSYVDFEDEVQMLKKYLELEQLRFRDNFQYIIKGDQEIDGIKIPTMIIQPYIENAIKHGLLHKNEGDKKLRIEFIQEDVLKCIITDNGVGMEVSKRIKKENGISRTSFSTSAIKDRMTFLRDYYKTDIGVTYEEIAEGTCVVIKIPYK